MDLKAIATYIRKLGRKALPAQMPPALTAVLYRLALRIAPQWTVRRHLKTLESDLSRASMVLPQISRQIGEQFLGSEQLLEELTETGEKLLSDSHDLLGLASGQDQGRAIVDETRNLLEGPLAYLDLWQQDLAGRLAQLTTARNLIRGVKSCEEALERCVLPLRFTQSMFRMESAALPEGVRQVFSSLTGRIDEIEREVRETLSRQFRTISATSETIDHVVAKVTALGYEVEQTVFSRRREVSVLLATLTAEIEKNRGREIELITNSQEISTQTGRLVVALQAHDIISQKMEHVRAGLNTCIEGIRSISGPVTSANLKKTISSLRGLLEVQSAQAASFYRDLHEAEATLRDGTGHIHEQAKLLDSDCLLLKEYSQVTGAASGTVETLLEIISDIRDLIQKAVSAAHESCELITPVAGVVTGLTGSLDHLSHEMRLISLNSQIQAVQIGLGTGLEVLSAHTVDVSLETTDLTGELSIQLDQFTSDIQAVLSGLQELSLKGDAEIEDFHGKATDQESRLHGLRDLMLSKLHAVGDAAEHIGRSTATMAAHPRMGQEIDRPLARVVEIIDGACLKFRTIAPFVEQSDLTGQLNRPEYTMASERRIHQAVVARLSQAAPAAGDSNSNHSESDGGAVELF